MHWKFMSFDPILCALMLGSFTVIGWVVLLRVWHEEIKQEERFISGAVLNPLVTTGNISEILKLLERKKVSINENVNSYGPLLTNAVLKNQVDLVWFLVRYEGANVNIQSPYFHFAEDGLVTPLHIACNFGFVECARILLEAGAKTHLLGESGTGDRVIAGNSVAELAVKHAHLEIIKLLQTYGYDLNQMHINRPPFRHAENTNIGRIERDRASQTLLTLALEERMFDVAEYLVAQAIVGEGFDPAVYSKKWGYHRNQNALTKLYELKEKVDELLTPCFK